MLIYSEDWRSQVEELKPSLHTRRTSWCHDQPAAQGERDFAERDRLSLRSSRIGPELTLDDPWGIYYTGGTTGLPKGAVLTHGNVTWNSINTITSWGSPASHKAALQLPFFHIGGPNIFMAPLVHAGGTTILCQGFDPDETFDLVEHSGITHYVGVPTMFQMLQEHPRWDDADFSRLELVISGGAPCPLPIMEKFWDRGVDFKMGYGLTEASGNNFWLPAELVREKIGSVGYPDISYRHEDHARDDGSSCDDWRGGRIADPRPARVGRVLAEIRKRRLRRFVMAGCTLVISPCAMTMVVTRFSADRRRCLSAVAKMSIRPRLNLCCWRTRRCMEAAVVSIPHETWGEVGRAFVVGDEV